MDDRVILRVGAKVLIPFILIFALYVQFHGDYGPGGGFQAGVIFAAAFVLYVELRREWFPSPMPSELTTPLPDGASAIQVLHREFLVWFRQRFDPGDEVVLTVWNRQGGRREVRFVP